ncbi:MAG: AAA family ATPase [Pseudobdellovibrionaceae bacterium]|nr:AAA family ATPase [Pseudobdellovibrionaceae bacterium]
MKRYILTGAPGAGKTTILHDLQSRGYEIVAEAATDINARMIAQGIDKPWTMPHFISDIIQLQKARLESKVHEDSTVQFHDRSIIDAYILGKFLGHGITADVEVLVQAIIKNGVYQRMVFFIDSLGFIENTEVRRISLADALEFGKLHEQIYSSFGFQCIKIPNQQVNDRTNEILRLVETQS